MQVPDRPYSLFVEVPMEKDTRDAVEAAAAAFNAALLAAQMASADGTRMKLTVRTMPNFGAAAKCPQVKLEFVNA